MRGFTKAAALLSSTWASALVIPETDSLSSISSNLAIQYRNTLHKSLQHSWSASRANLLPDPHEALLEFTVKSNEPIDPV